MRENRTYRANRRNTARDAGAKFPLPIAITKIVPVLTLGPNKRDRSEEAEAKRSVPAIDFTGKVGLARSQINYKLHTVFKKKPKRGWAAKARRAPFRHYFAEQPQKMEEAMLRHAWARKLKERGELQLALAA